MALAAAHVGILNFLVGFCTIRADFDLLVKTKKTFGNFPGEDHMWAGIGPYDLRDQAGCTVFDLPRWVGIND